MKMIILYLVMMSMAFSAKSILQGNEVGNGGDVLVCNNRPLQLLDFYEAESQGAFKIIKSEKSHGQLIRRIIGTLSELDPKSAKYYQKQFQLFFENTQIQPGLELTDIQDSEHLSIPVNGECKLQQIAILRKKVLSPGKKFLISKDLWDKLDEVNKAGLILHELIYERLAFLGEKNSIKARHYTSLLFSQGFKGLDKKSYWKLVKEMKIQIYK